MARHVLEVDMQVASVDKRDEGTGRPEDAVPPPRQQVVYGLQHVLTMYAGMVTPPLIIGHAAHLSPAQIGILVTACTFLSGIATLVQALGLPMRLPIIGSQLPVIQGPSIAAVSTLVAIIAAGDGGLAVAFGSIIVVCLLGAALSTVWRYLDALFPPVVTGVSVTIIGLALFPVAFHWAMGGAPQSPQYGSTANIGLATATLLVILLVTRLRVAALARVSILIGIVAGMVLAMALGQADVSGVADGSLIAIPTLFPFGLPEFRGAAIAPLVIVVLVMLVEATAVFKAMGDIVGTQVDAARVGRGLRSDMLFSALAPCIGALPLSTFAQNAGLVAMTRVRSRYVVAAAGVILVLIGVLPAFGRLMAAIPAPVLGGAAVALFGAIAVNGLQTLSRVDYTLGGNILIVGVSLGIGLLPAVAPEFSAHLPGWLATIMHSGITTASLSAIVLNVLFNGLGARRPAAALEAAPEPGRPVVGA
jgi:uric acid transporter